MVSIDCRPLARVLKGVSEVLAARKETRRRGGGKEADLSSLVLHPFGSLKSRSNLCWRRYLPLHASCPHWLLSSFPSFLLLLPTISQTDDNGTRRAIKHVRLSAFQTRPVSMEQTREEELSTQMGTQLRRRRRYVKGRSRRKKKRVGVWPVSEETPREGGGVCSPLSRLLSSGPQRSSSVEVQPPTTSLLSSSIFSSVSQAFRARVRRRERSSSLNVH